MFRSETTSVNDLARVPSTREVPDASRNSICEKTHIYGSFRVGSTEFALAVSAIREVVNEPEQISPLPLAPDFLMGLFNLRGMIIPIIDLRTLLELPTTKTGGVEESRKVAIVENGDRCVGILFDCAGEVLNAGNASRVDFRANDAGVKDVVIDGVLKLENGERMVQILDPYELLRLEKVPQAKESTKNSGQKSDRGKRLSCVSFQLGHTWCAIDLRFVREVKNMPKLDKSLLSHGFVIGTITIRGEIVPVVDFRSFMGNEPVHKFDDAALAKRKLLIVQTHGGPIGLMVFSIDSIMTFYERDVMPFAKLALPRGGIVKGCLINDDEQLVMLLDHERLMSEPSLTEPARTCKEVHSSEDMGERESEEIHKVERRTFILFSISNHFAMDSRCVSEVINKPDNLLEPPYSLEFVDGIINLRGDLITLINLRSLYGMTAIKGEDEKVLVFIHNDQKYAVLVDSVDEIIMTTSDQVASDNLSGYNETVKKASDDVSGVLHYSREGEGPMSVMIMDVDALVARCVGLIN